MLCEAILKLVAVIMFIVSVVFAVVGSQIMNPLLWAVWSFAVLAVFAGIIP